jgi:type I restriction-modification system DNA methylase subunit
MFQNTIIKKYISSQSKDLLISKWGLFREFFHDKGTQDRIRVLKEEQFQEGFLIKLFVEVFGYIKEPDENYNLVTELKNIKDSRKVDGALIFNTTVKCVIELKGTNTTDLGKVEVQAFSYKTNQPNCTYVITSNFEKLRFYIQDATEFIEFNLFELTQDEFNLMYLCLSTNSIENDIPLKLKSESISQEDLITKKLYKDYSLFKRELYQNLIALNQGYDKLLLFKKSQKLLDRFLFLFFAEDKFLLPPNSVRLILDDWEDLIEKDVEVPLYNRFKKYFGYLNTGFKGKRYDVFPYNGGLFKSDEILDNILIDDKLLFLHTKKLSEYDFESEVDVNILGHIFENSLTEIEEISNELKNGEVDKTNTKRKKDGVFYTPKYITKYIVNNTIGKLCNEKKNELQINDEDYTSDKKRIKKTIKNLSDKLTEYRNWLLQLTICDPACGSGAFLNQSLNFLISEHQYIDELQSKLFGDSMVLSDIENSILENNLFGVDINEESVEITKLSLWLRTAQPNRKLNSLSSNIKCGNSLIDEPIEGVENYFKWEQEFPKVFEKGGFDVVIGNPPFVQLSEDSNTTIHIKNYLLNRYKSSMGRLNTFGFFLKLSLTISRKNGISSYIIPNTILTQEYYKKIRLDLLNDSEITEIIQFLELPFQDAVVENVILSYINKHPKKTNSIKIINSKIREFSLNKEINQSEFLNNLDYNFNIYEKKENKLIKDKLDKNNVKLGELTDVNQAIALKGSRDLWVHKEILDFNYVKVLEGGKNINRYVLNWGGDYLDYKKEGIHSCHSTKIFTSEEKIFFRRVANKLIGTLDTNKLYGLHTLVVINIKKNYKSSINIKYILSLFNSKVLSYYYKTNFSSTKTVFSEIGAQKVRLLPIVEISLPQQKPFIEKVDLILSLNKELQNQSEKFQRTIQRNFEGLEVLPKKLQNWYLLTYNEFIKELSKKKVKLSLEDEGKWEDFFTQESKKALEIKNSIEKTDKEIDTMVYQLYNLTDDEIEIIESTI